MARQTLSAEAVEESTYVVRLPFIDEDGTAVTPSAATWSLTNMAGEVINSQEDVAISPLAATVDILLTGDDLAILSATDDGRRLLTLKATYSSSLGGALPLREEFLFIVRRLVAVP